MNKLNLISFLLLLVNFGFAQNDTLKLLKGEWYYFGPTRPEANDTFRLSRETNYNFFTKWEFKDNGSFIEEDINDIRGADTLNGAPVISIALVYRTWVFNKENQTVEIRDVSEVYRIKRINENYLELLRLK